MAYMMSHPFRLAAAISCIAWIGFSHAAYADTVIIFQNNYGPQTYGFALKSTEPYNYEKLTEAPQTISLTFTQPVDKEKSYIKLYDLYGAQINDGTVTIEDNRMLIKPAPLAKGRYKVKWKARCKCSEGTS